MNEQQQQQQRQLHPGDKGDHEQPPKRPAYAGQWRTPENPVFPNQASTTQPAAAAASAGATSTTTTVTAPLDAEKLPVSTEDYVKALQEAYLRGAEAAAAMAQQQQDPTAAAAASSTVTVSTTNTTTPAVHSSSHIMSTAASCPDLQSSMVPSVNKSSNQTQPQQPLNVNVNSNTKTATPSAAASSANATRTTGPAAAAAAAANPAAPPILPLPVVPNPLMAPNNMPPPAPVVGERSMSLPNMSAYASQQQEEAKRQKRLARNRASARLRRLRKKNLVDAYETEVGLLEGTLQKLKLHHWGSAADHSSLVQALSMDRGQQELSATERQEAAKHILQQQLAFCQQLEELMQEQYVLIQVAMATSTTPQQDQHQQQQQQQADASWTAQLQETLQLTPAQCHELRQGFAGWQEEWTALQTVKESLLAMNENAWLWDQGVSAMAEQFMNLLHKNQISKFLLWADHNVEALDEMDSVHTGPPPQGPVFYFGVDSTPMGGMGEVSSNSAGATATNHAAMEG